MQAIERQRPFRLRLRPTQGEQAGGGADQADKEREAARQRVQPQMAADPGQAEWQDQPLDRGGQRGEAAQDKETAQHGTAAIGRRGRSAPAPLHLGR